MSDLPEPARPISLHRFARRAPFPPACGQAAPVILAQVSPAPARPAAPPEDLLAIGSLSPAAQAWLKAHPRPPNEIIPALLEFAATCAWRDAKQVVAAPWGRELAAYVALHVLRRPKAILTCSELLEGFRAHLEGKETWPGDRRVQFALRPLVMALFGAAARNDLKDATGKPRRAWSGLAFSPACPPCIPESVGASVSPGSGISKEVSDPSEPENHGRTGRLKVSP